MTKTHTLLGKSYPIAAEFPNTPEGLIEMKARIRTNPQLTVLTVAQGRVLLTTQEKKAPGTGQALAKC